jgi:hypothetical protein
MFNWLKRLFGIEEQKPVVKERASYGPSTRRYPPYPRRSTQKNPSRPSPSVPRSQVSDNNGIDPVTLLLYGQVLSSDT